MSQGTLFADAKARVFSAEALIKHFKLDVDVSDRSAKAYKDNFPLNKVPTFLGPKGFKLSEAIAVNIYRMYLMLLRSNDERKFSKLYSYPCLNTLCREFHSEAPFHSH